MITKRADASQIAIGDTFLNIVEGGRLFHEGIVDGLTEEDVQVDFGNFRVEYDREDCGFYEEICGYVREFYACTSTGDIIERFS